MGKRLAISTMACIFTFPAIAQTHATTTPSNRLSVLIQQDAAYGTATIKKIAAINPETMIFRVQSMDSVPNSDSPSSTALANAINNLYQSGYTGSVGITPDVDKHYVDKNWGCTVNAGGAFSPCLSNMLTYVDSVNSKLSSLGSKQQIQSIVFESEGSNIAKSSAAYNSIKTQIINSNPKLQLGAIIGWTNMNNPIVSVVNTAYIELYNTYRSVGADHTLVDGNYGSTCTNGIQCNVEPGTTIYAAGNKGVKNLINKDQIIPPGNVLANITADKIASTIKPNSNLTLLISYGPDYLGQTGTLQHYQTEASFWQLINDFKQGLIHAGVSSSIVNNLNIGIWDSATLPSTWPSTATKNTASTSQSSATQ